MHNIREHSHLPVPGHGPHTYIDNSDNEGELRLTLCNDGFNVWMDLRTEYLAALRDLIDEALFEAGCCEHGRDDEIHCPECFMQAEADNDNEDE